MMTLSRRGAIGIGAAGLINIKSIAARAQTTPQLKAVVTISGQTYEFKQENGEDLGDFVSTIGGFTQRCIRSEVSGFPLTVFFRPDRNSDRVEVVFELGRIFNATPANLGAYTAVIWRGTQKLTTVNVPEHYWFARWRWQSSPRPVVADIAKLVSDNLIPLYDRSAVAPPPAPAVNLMPLPNGDYINVQILAEFAAGNYANAAKLIVTSQQYAAMNTTTTSTATISTSSSIYTTMGLAGVTAYMPRTGERADIGPMTEPQAKFICTNDQASLDLLRAQAEAAGTMPWHMRDETQTSPFDFRKYPNASWYSSSNGGSPHVKTASTPITVDSAHQPALAYLPYILTGDPYHLEDLQFQATYNWGVLPAPYRPSIPQARAFAWSTRTLAQCARVTPATTPSWLLPQSYWSAQLTTTREWFETNYVNSARPERARFRVTCGIDNTREETKAPQGTWADPWQDEFVATILGWVVSMGFSDWRAAFDWSIGGTIARTSSTSGWVRAHATPYRMILRASRTSPVAESWAAAWELTESIAGLTYTDPNTWVSGDMNYLAYSRGALVYGAKLGAPGAAENLAWATAQIKARSFNTPAKWRFGTGL